MLACWLLNMKAVTEDLFADDEIYSEINLSDFAFCEQIASNVETSYFSSKNSRQPTSGLTQAVRPQKITNRPLTGVYNLECIEKSEGSIAGIVSGISRPITTYYKRGQRKGTSCLKSNSSKNNEPLHVTRLDLEKYAQHSEIACSVFEYLFYIAKEYREALNLVNVVCNNTTNNTSKSHQQIISEYLSVNGNSERKLNFMSQLSRNEPADINWWWLLQKARCLYCLGLTREAEHPIKLSLELNPTVESFTLFAFIALRFDQPARALGIYDEGLQKFPCDTDLLTGKARIYQKLNDISQSVAVYKTISEIDNMNIESLASIAMYYFYEDQPEISLKYYRRILQYGYESTELYNNLGLCTYYTQQYDICLSFFNQAIALSDATNFADVYYNLSHIAINVGDLQMAHQCLYISIVNDSNNAEAYNNLGVLEQKLGNIDMAKELYKTSCRLTPCLFEPYHNLAFLTETIGELHTAFDLAKRSLSLFPNHGDLQNLLFRLKEYFTST
ncbi:unnamed protein product [Heterobilharzia americana]|nr:unnamed protein product [Heterobilharzia americana]